MNLIDVKSDNISDYYKTSLLLVFPNCSFKCGECCQNLHLKDAQVQIYSNQDIIDYYNKLTTHHAIVFAGLEPFDSFNEICNFTFELTSNKKPVDIVIYTGYELKEIKDKIIELFNNYNNNQYNNLIIKFGRYHKTEQDDSWNSKVLGVKLSTNNQEVIKICKLNKVEYENNKIIKIYKDLVEFLTNYN